MKWVEAHRKLHPLNGISLCGATLCGITMKPLAQKRQRLPKKLEACSVCSSRFWPPRGHFVCCLPCVAIARDEHAACRLRSAVALLSRACGGPRRAATLHAAVGASRSPSPRDTRRRRRPSSPRSRTTSPPRARRPAPAAPPQPRARAPRARRGTWGGELWRTYETSTLRAVRAPQSPFQPRWRLTLQAAWPAGEVCVCADGTITRQAATRSIRGPVADPMAPAASLLQGPTSR
jgi:hypothetical protein